MTAPDRHPESLDGWAWPAAWTAEAVETANAVATERGETLAAAEVGILEQVGWLLTSAARALTTAEAADYVATTDRGGSNLHGGVVAHDRARVQAGALLRRLVPPASASSSGAGRALAGKRWGR